MDSQLYEFLSETKESLDAIDAEVIRFTHSPADHEIFNTVFRVVHSIKGASSFLSLPAIEAAAHAAETQLEKFRGAEDKSTEAKKLIEIFSLLRAVVMKTEVEEAAAIGIERFSKTRTQRVSVELLQQVKQSVAELVTARNTFVDILQQSANTEFAKPLERLSMISNELQKSVAHLVRVPLYQSMQMLPRSIHELAATLEKTIDFESHGGDILVEADIIEQLKGPLLQLVRNAADHGLENAEARLAYGKPSSGKITITARESDNTLTIEVCDDGKGLDYDTLREVIARDTIITPVEFDLMSDEEISKLLFTPGFTTAEKLTPLSGRGYGLDIVRANIEALGGRITMRSVHGKGTSFIITLPQQAQETAQHVFEAQVLPAVQTVATLDDTKVSFLVFRAGSERQKAVPAQLLTRLEQIDMRQIKKTGGNSWVYSGEDVVPLVYVNATLATQTNALQPMLVFSDMTRAMGLVVDEIIGVVQAPLGIDFTDATDDAIGSILLDHVPTDIIDIGYYLPLAFGGAAQHVHEETATVVQGLQGKKLIFVEDNAFFRDMLMPVLKNAGFDVEVFSSATDALDALKSETLPAAIVSDIDMPGMNGFDFARTLKADMRMADVPLIALSSYLSRSAAEKGREAGFKSYIAKFDRQGLLKALKKGIAA
ncbi:MAG: ATP-binding protein [Pseudomonadota bacterium]